MKKYIGTKEFYKMVLLVAVPIMIQNGITNFVGMLDNIMVGQVGTNEMSGVAIINQMMLVFNISIFGAVSGAGIFGAQYYGCKDYEGVRYAFRYKLIACLLVVGGAIALFLTKGDALIGLYLSDTSDAADCAKTLVCAREYLLIMLLGLLPFALEQAYSATLRETGETMLPMKAGVAAVLMNLIFNYLLIFGTFGFPKLGVNGAAIATVISRYVQAAIVIYWSHKHLGRKPDNAQVQPYPFLHGVYRNFKIPAYLVGRITVKATPLMINEAMWALGVAGMMQCYSVRGLAVVAGMNISNTITNVFSVVYMAMGNAIAIILGQLLGAGKTEEAKDTAGKLIFFSVASCVALALVMMVFAPLFPEIYNTSDEVKKLSGYFIQVAAIAMPLCAFTNASYFTLRSGGKTVVTFFFDSVFMWTVAIPLAYILSRFTNLPIVPLYLICQFTELIKCLIGYILVKKGIWIQNMTNRENAD